MMDAERGGASFSAKVGQRLKVATSFGVAVTILRRDHSDGIDYDKPNIANSSNLASQRDHVSRRIEGARRAIVANPTYDLHPATIGSGGLQPGN
jgi:hypothetical protein